MELSGRERVGVFGFVGGVVKVGDRGVKLSSYKKISNSKKCKLNVGEIYYNAGHFPTRCLFTQPTNRLHYSMTTTINLPLCHFALHICIYVYFMIINCLYVLSPIIYILLCTLHFNYVLHSIHCWLSFANIFFYKYLISRKFFSLAPSFYFLFHSVFFFLYTLIY